MNDNVILDKVSYSLVTVSFAMAFVMGLGFTLFPGTILSVVVNSSPELLTGYGLSAIQFIVGNVVLAWSFLKLAVLTHCTKDRILCYLALGYPLLVFIILSAFTGVFGFSASVFWYFIVIAGGGFLPKL